MTEPLRILELRSVRGTGGGPDKTILLGTAATDPRRFAITVCYLRDQRDDVFTIDQWARRVGVDYVEICERHSLDVSVVAALRNLVRSRRIQIVHAHDFKSNLLAFLLSKCEDVLPLSTAHGWTGHSRRDRLCYYPTDKRVLTWFPKLIAVSSEIRTELIRRGAIPDRVVVVLNGIDHRLFSRSPSNEVTARRTLQIADDEIAIGAVGRLEPQKRFDILLRAVARVRAHRPNIRLFIAGDGSLRSELERISRELSLEHACHLLGHCTDVAAVHHAFDLFVQSSDYEGTPNAVLEAMAMRTPLIATDVGGTSELATHGVHGLIVPPGDIDALAGAIEHALTDVAATRVRANAARDRIERDLSFTRRMQRVEAVYDELMARRPAKHWQDHQTA